MMNLKLYCIPYAGGSANVYWNWKKQFEQCVLVEYKGHGSLFCEPMYQTIQQAAEDIVQRYLAGNTEPYMLYGHSMGSLVVFEIGNLLQKNGYRKPEHIVLSAMRPPHLLYRKKKYTHLPKSEFMEQIFTLGNTPRELLEDEEMRDLFYEILFADMKLVESYQYDSDTEPLDIPLSIFAGIEDKQAPVADLQEWEQYTKKAFSLETFTGNHFFAFQGGAMEAVCTAIKKRMEQCNGISAG